VNTNLGGKEQIKRWVFTFSRKMEVENRE